MGPGYSSAGKTLLLLIFFSLVWWYHCCSFYVRSYVACFCSTFLHSQVRTVMFPVTVVNRFLKRQTPQIPLPPNIEEEYDSRSDSWLLFSKSQSSPRDPQAQTTSSIACQTSSFSETTEHRPRSQVRDDLYDEQDALPPPSFRPRSKLPKLHYGGLPKPPLHCFTSSRTNTFGPSSVHTTFQVS